MPAITEANLAQCTAGHGARQPQRELIASMKTKKARPATDTGMPPLVPAGILDQTLVVTATQLIVPRSEQPAKLVASVKCWMVRKIESARPSSVNSIAANGKPPPDQRTA